MTVLDDCYHIVTIDKQRDIVAERTVDFTARLVAKLAKLTVKQKAATENATPVKAEVAKQKRAAA